MKTISFPIAGTVRVKLTQIGRDYYRKKNDQIYGGHPNLLALFTMPEEDSDGWSDWSLLSLMGWFGDYPFMTDEWPFDEVLQIVTE